MLKKIIAVFAVIALMLSFTAFAKEEFLVYGKDNEKLAQALNITESELESYCKNNSVTYFAINGGNTKQIRKTETVDEFSKKTVDFSVLSDDKILSVASDVSGFGGVKGEIVNKGGYKLLKLRLQTADSGGKFILTQYITVKNSKKTVLSFYTADGESEEYITENLNSQFKDKANIKPFVIGGVAVFAAATVFLAVLIVKDFKKKPQEQ